MQRRNWIVRVVGALAVAGGMATTGGTARAQEKVVKVDGSSTVFPITEAVAEEFQNSTKGEIKVTVGISGTGGGMKKFVRNEIDVADASRPISAEEMTAAKVAGIEFIELPIGFDALTVAVNPANTWCESITVEELKKMWEPAAQGVITKWSQVRAGWPDEPIQLYGAGSDSGTFDYFTEAVCGKSKASRGDYTGSEDDNVLVKGIEGNKHALGYLPFSYYVANAKSLKAVKIDWEKDAAGPMEPSLENVLAAKYNPLSRPLFIYVNKKSLADKPWVKEFVEFYLSHASELITEVHYLPLQSESYQMCRERAGKLQAGTGFGGHNEIGITVEELLKRTPVTEAKPAPEKKDAK